VVSIQAKYALMSVQKRSNLKRNLMKQRRKSEQLLKLFVRSCNVGSRFVRVDELHKVMSRYGTVSIVLSDFPIQLDVTAMWL